MGIESYRTRGIIAGTGVSLLGVGALAVDQVVAGWGLLLVAGFFAGYFGGTDGPDGATTAFYAVVPLLLLTGGGGLAWLLVEGGTSGLAATIGLVLAVVLVQYGMIASAPILLGGAVGGSLRRRYGAPLDEE